MDKMLHRGEYIIKEENIVVEDVPLRGWKMLGMGKEFTKGDKVIYIIAYSWTLLWITVFIIGTVFNLSGNVPDSSWMTFWKTFIIINFSASSIIVLWFTVGGIKDFKDLLRRLTTMIRDPKDDGSVRKENNDK